MALEDSNRLMQAYVEKAMVDLPSLPTSIVQVVQATERETVSTHEIEELIGSDPAIAIKLLKVVNSAYFGMPRQISSINQSIAILGLHQVRNLVLSIGVLNALNSDSVRVEKMQRKFWERSFGAAACAQIIAEYKGLPSLDQETLFVGGLLHDVGILFLFTQFTTPYSEVLKHAKENNEPLIDVERRVMHIDHAVLGGMLARKWNFPENLEQLISNHEEPGEPDKCKIVSCVHIADRIACEVTSDGVASCVQELDESYKIWLGMGADEYEGLKFQVKDQISQAAELLGILG